MTQDRSDSSLWQLVIARFRLDADRLDLGRVGITPAPVLLSTFTARDIATRLASHELST